MKRILLAVWAALCLVMATVFVIRWAALIATGEMTTRAVVMTALIVVGAAIALYGVENSR